MKKVLLSIFMLVLGNLTYAQQEYKRAEINRLWEILAQQGAGKFRRQTSIKQLQDLAKGFTDCHEDKSIRFMFQKQRKGKDCSTIDSVNHLIHIYGLHWDNHLVWYSKFGPHTYGSYDDKLFFVYRSSDKASPTFEFSSWRTQVQEEGGCLTGFVKCESNFKLILTTPEKTENPGNGATIHFIPELGHVGKKITLEHIFSRYNRTSCNGSGLEPDDHYKKSIITVEPPHWIDSKKQELSSICNDYGTINIFDYFSLSLDDTPITSWSDISFYLNDVQLTTNNLDINSLKPGIHTLKAKKQYDNGWFEGDFQFTVRPVSKITIGEYRNVVCVNEPLRTITAFVDGKVVGGGSWAGEGIDIHGNFEPQKAGVGYKKLTYTYKNTQSCVSSSDIFIDVKPLPVQATISGISNGCIGDVITLKASAADAASFGWYYKGEHIPFYEGATLTKTITGDDELYVRSISEYRCYSDEKTPIKIKSFTPFGRIANTIPEKDAIRQGASLSFKFIPDENRTYTYLWDFGDGETSSEQEPTHFFSKAGDFTIKAIVEDVEGCKNTIIYDNTIKVSEFPHWTEKAPSLNNSCNNIAPIDIFEYFSLDERHITITDFSGIKFHLDNDTELTSNIVDITGLLPGIHKITASKTYPSGTFEDSFTFKIRSSPKITLGEYPKGVCQTESEFLVPVFVNGKRAVGGTWSGDGIDHVGYFNPKSAGLGLKKLAYSFTNSEGCSEIKNLEIDVRAVPTTPVVTGKREGCIGDVVTLKAEAQNATQFAWYKSGENNPFFLGDQLNYTISKTEELYVKALNSEFCPSTNSAPIYVKCFAPMGKISTTHTSIKQHDLLSFSFHLADESQAKKYQWDFGDGFKSNKPAPEHYFNNAGEFTVKVKVQSPDGCDNTIVYDTKIKVEEIDIPPPAKVSFPKYVETPKKPLKLNVFPNPFKDWLKLTVDSEIDDVAEVRMYNQDGWLMYQKTLKIAKGENEIIMDDFQNLKTIVWQLKIDAKGFNINEVLLKQD